MRALEELLIQSNASIADRLKGVAFIEANPESFKDLFALACSSKKDRVNIVAAWVLEKHLIDKLDQLSPLLNAFLKGVAQQKHESKRRPMIKLLYHYCNGEKRRTTLTNTQKDQIVTLCFDYLLEAENAAPLAFSMKTLHFFRQHEDWIEAELQAYIEKQLPNCSSGFRSVVRQIS